MGQSQFAVVVYMVQNKEIDLSKMEFYRRTIKNINPEIFSYLCQFWDKFEMRQMMLYEMEDFYDIAVLDSEMEIKSAYLEELLSLYKKLSIEETEELLVNIMQIYSDSGLYNKAAAFMDKIVLFRSKEEKKNRSVIIKPRLEEETIISFTKDQIKGYMENFIGREDTYVIEEVDKNGKHSFVQILEPLTEEVLKKHFHGECTIWVSCKDRQTKWIFRC